jgi:hypothetical protein
MPLHCTSDKGEFGDSSSPRPTIGLSVMDSFLFLLNNLE